MPASAGKKGNCFAAEVEDPQRWKQNEVEIANAGTKGPLYPNHFSALARKLDTSWCSRSSDLLRIYIMCPAS